MTGLAGDSCYRRAVASVTRPVMPDPKREDEVTAPASICIDTVESSQPPQFLA